MRRHVPSTSRWAAEIGYSRAVQAGPLIEVAGISAVGADGAMIGDGDVALQFEACLTTLEQVLADLGAGVEDVVRTRIYLRTVEDWERCAPMHYERFGDTRPASSWFGDTRFVDDAMLVEIEATAWTEV
jgi:enamine deaminase RidA (YjgF/YER057c/UK114 family)